MEGRRGRKEGRMVDQGRTSSNQRTGKGVSRTTGKGTRGGGGVSRVGDSYPTQLTLRRNSS